MLTQSLRVALFTCAWAYSASVVVRADENCDPNAHHGPLAAIEHMKQKCGICGGGTGVYSDSSYFCLGRLFVKEWKVGDERAGNPRSISCLARPSNGPKDDGYYVGGGCACSCKAEMRNCDEGTWGWDYVGHYCSPFPIVDLGYWHGRRDQSGNYKTDGPKIFHCGE